MQPVGPEIALRFPFLFVSLVCVSALSYNYVAYPCEVSMADLTAVLSTDVSTISSLVQVPVRDDTRLTESGNVRSDSYS